MNRFVARFFTENKNTIQSAWLFVIIYLFKIDSVSVSSWHTVIISSLMLPDDLIVCPFFSGLGLQALTKDILDADLNKDISLRAGNWEREALTKDQVLRMIFVYENLY